MDPRTIWIHLDPIPPKTEPWRSDPLEVFRAQSCLRNFANTTPTVGQLARAFLYYYDDELVRGALTMDEPLVDPRPAENRTKRECIIARL